MRLLAQIFILLTTVAATAAETNYFCVVCGKGPLTGRIWMSKWGAVCDDCYRLENHCSICGLPVRPGDGCVKTGDGRYICKFDKPDAVLDSYTAREIFAAARRGLVELYGGGFALNFPDVTVNLFDVDYWSEKSHNDGLHKFGFSSTRRSPSGVCTHEVVMLSGRLRAELAATAAHEYTHLWINENIAPGRAIEPDTLEAVCELSAYTLMGAERQPEMQKKILENPYTHGKIKTLVTLAESRGVTAILDWVKTGETAGLDAPAAANWKPASAATGRKTQLPADLRFTGFFTLGTNDVAIINGLGFAPGERRSLRLRNGTALVDCREIRAGKVLVESNGIPTVLELERSK
jgi:hypothetical protein